MDTASPTTSPRFWNRIARRYSRSKIADEAAYQHKLAATQGYFTPEMSVLEIGCGTGGTAREHARHVARYRATDFSPAMIEIARERAAETPADNLSFEVASIEQIPASDGPYDAVLALSVLHLVADLPGVLARIHALLPQGGVFVSSTACLADFGWPVRVFVAVGRGLRIFPPVQRFTRNALRDAVERAGFEIVYDWAPGPRAALFLVARKR
jgi:ubiquinone/menaquinone biosynthesis C-methylase UbiE